MTAPRPAGGRVAVGHPVDVASGVMFRASDDFRVPGRMELAFVRHYSTAMLDEPAGPLGPGWTHDLLLTLTATPDGFVFRGRGGTATFFERTPENFGDGRPLYAFGAFSELAWERGTFVVTVWDPDRHDAERFVFAPGAAGTPSPVRRIEASMGRAVDLAYDADGRLARAVQRREGRAFRFVYEGRRLGAVEFVAPTGASRPLLRFAYDADGRLAAAYDPLGTAETFAYDAAGRITRETTRSGGVFEFTYDRRGRCVRTEGTNGYDKRLFRYYPETGWTEVVDSRGALWGYAWAGDGQVSRTLTPTGASYATEYDDHRRIVAEVDAYGRRTAYAYDAAGNRSAVTDALGRTTRYAYNAARQLVRRTDAAGGAWTLEYDAGGLLRAAADPLGNRWAYDLNEFGEVVRIVNPAGAEMRYAYGPLGEHLETVDWDGHTVRFAQDGFGCLEAVVDPRGRATRYQYDALLRPTRVEWPDGTARGIGYDAWGNIVAIDEPDGSQSRYRYGTCGRLTHATDALGRTTRFRWGTERGQLAEIINPRGESYRFEYDAAGRPVAEVDFAGRRRTTTFDGNGFYVRQSNGAGEETVFEVDAAGQLVRKRLPDGSTVEFAYDLLGRISAAQNSSCRVAFERDPLGRVLRETRGDFVVESRYDALGNRVARASSLGHRADFAYDRNGGLLALALDSGRPIRFERDEVGRETARWLPNGLVLRHTYDLMGRLRGQELGPPERATAVVARQYAFDAASRVVSLTDRRSGAAYQYDAAGQLVAATRAARGAEEFAFDATGNLARAVRSTADPRATADVVDLGFDYRPGDELARCGTTAYDSDDDGRTVRKRVGAGTTAEEVWAYAWDGEGWLASVTRPDRSEVRYAYDPFGRRIRREDGVTTTEFVWDGDTVCHEVQSGRAPETWVFHPDDFTPLCKQVGRSAYYVITDHQGTPRELVSDDARVVWAARRWAWGAPDGPSPPDSVDCSVGFPGQWYEEETGLSYNRFRYYDPSAGRYLSPDPQGVLGGLNLYQYVPAPTAWADPFGLVTQTQTVNGRTYTYDQDSQGRVVRAEGPMCNPNRITDPQRDRNAQRALSAGTGYDAGHLIGNQFGGPGGGDNLVLMCPSMNQYGSWAKMERQLVGITANNSVRVVVTVHYKGASNVPSHFTVDAYITDRKGRTTQRRWTHTNC